MNRSVWLAAIALVLAPAPGFAQLEAAGAGSGRSGASAASRRVRSSEPPRLSWRGASASLARSASGR